MKTIFLFLICFAFSVLQANAQEKYSQLIAEKCSAIRSIQSNTDSNTYMDTKTQTNYKITFPSDNFNMLLSTGLAYQATYMQSEKSANEQLYLTENIDLSKGLKVISSTISKNSSLQRIIVEFPKDAITTKVIENGLVINTIISNTIFFYYRTGDESSKNELQRTIAELIYDAVRWERETGKKRSN